MSSLKDILRPVITEKSFAKSSNGWYSFLVKKNIKKNIAKQLIEKIFGVKVEKIKSISVKGKNKRSSKTRKLTIGSELKKIMVKLAKDQKIDLFESGGSK